MISDQHYNFQSRLALRFLAGCRKLAGEKTTSHLMEQVIKIFGRLLQADLLFLASLASAKKTGEMVIQPLVGLSFQNYRNNYSKLRGKGLAAFTLPGLKHYEKRAGKIPTTLIGRKMIRYMVSDRLTLYFAQEDEKGPKKRTGDYCLVFAWNKDFSGPLVNEGQIYTNELFVLISELGAYVINKILLELRYKEISATYQTTGSFETFLAVQKEFELIPDEEKRAEKTNFANNWAVMEVINQVRPQSIDGLIYFIEMNLKHEDMITRSAVLRVWEWLEWAVKNEGSPKDKEQIKELKVKFEEKDKTGKTLKGRQRDKIIDHYKTVMGA